MSNKKIYILIFLMISVLILTSCMGIKYTTNGGTFTKSESNDITAGFMSESTKGFYVSLDFELSDGRVDWEIRNPQNELVFKGNVFVENGKVYKELTGVPKYDPHILNKIEEVIDETDSFGKIIHGIEYSYLGFDSRSPTGEYRFILIPTGAEGSYMVQWSDKHLRK